MNKAFKKYGKKKYRETRFIFGWFEAEVKRGVFRYLDLKVAENCDPIDRLFDFPVAQRDVYGSDKNSKPNYHCRWDDYHMYWIETGEHFADRIRKGEFKLPGDIHEIEIKGKLI